VPFSNPEELAMVSGASCGCVLVLLGLLQAEEEPWGEGGNHP